MRDKRRVPPSPPSRLRIRIHFPLEPGSNRRPRYREYQRIGDSAFRGKRDNLTEVEVALAANDFEPSGRHARSQHLKDWTPRLDCVVLALVAEENDALDLLLTSGMKEPIHLACGEEAGLVDDPQLLVAGRSRWILQQAGDGPRAS
jgi:hypothetical protein